DFKFLLQVFSTAMFIVEIERFLIIAYRRACRVCTLCLPASLRIPIRGLEPFASAFIMLSDASCIFTRAFAISFNQTFCWLDVIKWPQHEQDTFIRHIM